MAKNGSKGNGRKGAVRGRSQVYNPKIEKYVKRDAKTGHFMDVKSSGKKFKGVTDKTKK